MPREKKTYWKEASIDRREGRRSLTVENHTSTSKISKLSIRQFQNFFSGTSAEVSPVLRRRRAELISTKLKKYRCRYFISIDAQEPSVNTKQNLFFLCMRKKSFPDQTGRINITFGRFLKKMQQ